MYGSFPWLNLYHHDEEGAIDWVHQVPAVDVGTAPSCYLPPGGKAVPGLRSPALVSDSVKA